MFVWMHACMHPRTCAFMRASAYTVRVLSGGANTRSPRTRQLSIWLRWLSVRVCVCACVRACKQVLILRACVRAYMWVCVHICIYLGTAEELCKA